MEKLLKSSISKLEKWISFQEYKSYDHYDFWSNKLGIIGRKLYYKNKYFGSPLVGILHLIDALLPHSRDIFFNKNISAEGMSDFARGYLRLYRIDGEVVYLEKALKCLSWLEKNSLKVGYGIGWGLHFDWWLSRTFVPKNTPCITITSNVVDAFLKGYEATRDIKYLEIAVKGAEFALNDLNKKVFGDDNKMVAVTYTPIRNRLVINANSFCAKMLYDVSFISGEAKYRDFADNILKYILSEQNDDGSWFYSDKAQVNDNVNFIDNLHTCFVLEHLYSVFLKNNNQEIKRAIEKGYSFFIDNFINNDYSCKHLHKYPAFTGIKVDIRSCADTIYCCALLSDLLPPSLDIAKKVAFWTISNMQDSKGFFYFRIYNTHKSKIPYMRWGQAPMFNALTYLYQKTKES